jgi:disulfide bond formation protein DsbB
MAWHGHKNLSSQNLSLLISLSSLLILLTTFLMEHGFNIPICRMCLLERYPYVAAVLVALASYFLEEKNPLSRWLKYALAVIFLISTGLSIYHLGLEHEWFDLPSFCQGSSTKAATVDALRAQIMSQKTFIPCNVVSLRIFFFSLAEWNAFASLFLLGLAWKSLKTK